jgi:DNA-binding transcriptional ArsR family regulator
MTMKRSQNGGLTDSQIARIGRVLADPRRVQILAEIATSTEPMPYIRLRETHRVSSATFSHHIHPEYGNGATQSRHVPFSASTRRHHGAGRNPRKAPPLAFCSNFDRAAPQSCRLARWGIKETLEMLDFYAKSGVVAKTETIPMQEVETAFARMVKNDVKYRFVVDMKSLKRNI